MFSNTPLIIILSNLSTFLPFFACTIFLRRLKRHKVMMLFWLFFTVALTTEMVVHYYSHLGEPNAWVIHLYTLVEYVLIVSILSMWQKKNRPALKIMRFSIPAYIGIYCILKFTGLENFEAATINYITRPLAILLIGGFVFYALSQLWVNASTQLHRDYRFWMLMAMGIYYSGSIIVFAFMYIKIQNTLLYLTYFHAVLNIIHNILFTVGIAVAFVFSPDRKVVGIQSNNLC